MDSRRIDPSTITSSVFAQLLQLYPEVQQGAYKAKLKDPKKLTTAQADHDWRYGELPQLVAGRSANESSSSSAYLEKGELVRLTQWKIVHGQHRPFLPGMVKKNDGERVKEVTSSAFDLQAGASFVEAGAGEGVPEALDKALREAALLHGVGPATATLVCSVYDPVNVCFFEDELAAWLCPDVPKLKYTWSEYQLLFAEVRKLRERLGFDYGAVDVEKVGFVLGHLNLLDEKQLEALTIASPVQADAGQESKNKAEASITSSHVSDPGPDGRASKSSTTATSTTKRKGMVGEDSLPKKDKANPRIKRRRK